jgi:hypothetical protein
MKKINLALLSILILFAAACLDGCTSNPSTIEAKSLSPNELCLEFMRPDIPMEQYSYLALREELHLGTLDAIRTSGDRAVIIPSGVHDITFDYFDKDRYSKPLLIRFNFEPGKYYYLDYKYTKGEFLKADTIDSFISEMPELLLNDAKNNFEKARLFLEWSIANPTALDGTWIKEKGSSFIGKITITGNKFKITMPLGFYTGNIEGRLFFDQNQIILYPDRHYSTKNNTDEEFNAPFTLQTSWLKMEIFYYERTGDSSLSTIRIFNDSNFFLNKKPVTFKLE